ncbi:AMIN domain-containing protein [Leptolyngbyaceae cyanobacterium JSC-12]|nr:AMIN domain-containing protein [Leptolyngbyaceae cyanobacterium JSC-12]
MLTFGAIALAAQVASAGSLTHWQYDAKANQLEVTVKQGTTPKYFLMAQPARIVLDLPNTEVGEVKLKESYSGAVRQVRVSQFQPGLTRIVLELSPEVELAPEQVKLEPSKGSSDRWVLRPILAKRKEPVAEPRSSTASVLSTTEPKPSAQIKPVVHPLKAVEPKKPVEYQPETASLPASAVGSDVSPVTVEPTPARISVPPLTPSATEFSPKVSVHVPPPQPLAQLPVEATTPLPPTTEQPLLGVEVTPNAGVQISVPPPVALPATKSEIRVEPVQTLQPAIAPKVTPSANSASNPPSFEIPSTVRTIPALSTQVTVPDIKPLAPSALPQQPVPTPPVIQVPPLPQGTVSPTPITSPTPATIIVQPSATSVAQPATPAPALVKAKPPASWVMQSSGMTPPVLPAATLGSTQTSTVNSAPTIAPNLSSSAPPPKSTPIPPASWVMQSSQASPPSLAPIAPSVQPPVSSVMQSPAISIPMMPSATSPAELPSSAMVSVPPLQAASPSIPPAAMPSTPSFGVPSTNTDGATVVEFGKPLPTQGATALNTMPRSIPQTLPASSWQQPAYVQSSNPAVVLPAGSILNASYPGQTELKLEAGDRPEVLILQTEVRDASGTVVFPQGSYVVGQFNSDREGSRFVASAIRTGDRVVPFPAQSEVLAGNRGVSTSSLAMYSGAGALAGGAISRFSGWGLLLGGIAGAATNYLTTPRTAVIQPGQLIQLRTGQDIR